MRTVRYIVLTDLELIGVNHQEVLLLVPGLDGILAHHKVTAAEYPCIATHLYTCRACLVYTLDSAINRINH